ncbi:hypothetical protein M422DRAFT_265221 [Sphaerobolus stellatus SS14]|uniref:Uncharacterized protein n=1 Tax=Sphaerobolus stellatus (strain SS14) TaxID=990650 RepID=A0A0C9V6A8_SPHS4|nr:hypothetical protein M422DRAFT_265221 [Sphaerobolus stellatus SS14]
MLYSCIFGTFVVKAGEVHLTAQSEYAVYTSSILTEDTDYFVPVKIYHKVKQGTLCSFLQDGSNVLLYGSILSQSCGRPLVIEAFNLLPYGEIPNNTDGSFPIFLPRLTVLGHVEGVVYNSEGGKDFKVRSISLVKENRQFSCFMAVCDSSFHSIRADLLREGCMIGVIGPICYKHENDMPSIHIEVVTHQAEINLNSISSISDISSVGEDDYDRPIIRLRTMDDYAGMEHSACLAVNSALLENYVEQGTPITPTFLEDHSTSAAVEEFPFHSSGSPDLGHSTGNTMPVDNSVSTSEETRPTISMRQEAIESPINMDDDLIVVDKQEVQDGKPRTELVYIGGRACTPHPWNPKPLTEYVTIDDVQSPADTTVDEVDQSHQFYTGVVCPTERPKSPLHIIISPFKLQESEHDRASKAIKRLREEANLDTRPRRRVKCSTSLEATTAECRSWIQIRSKSPETMKWGSNPDYAGDSNSI